MKQATYVYDETFFRYIQGGSIRSAQAIVPKALTLFSAQSVLDVGCGVGAWLTEYLRQGLTDCVGVDGDYVERGSLLIPESMFVPRDLSANFDLGRRFDLVQCLEVAEHLAPGTEATLVRSLVQHGDVVMFSAAVPGQGGENHVNERPLEFWRELFARQGYLPLDAIRPSVAGDASVEPWYRYNIIVYVSENRLRTLPESLRAATVKHGEAIPDVSPFLYRMRKTILRATPKAISDVLVALKHRAVIARARTAAEAKSRS